MPTTPDAFQSTTADYQDIYLNVFTSDLDTLLYGSYLGSSTYEHSHGGYSRFDRNGNLYYALCTQSSFPVSSPTYCSSASGYDMACFKMSFSDMICNPAIPPVPDFLCSQNSICPGSCVNFTNYSTNATSYLWNFQGGTPATSTATNPSGICFNAPGTYTISLTATNSGGSATLTRASLITVYVPVPVSLVQTGDTIFATPGFILYEWFYNGVPVSSGQQPWFVPTQNGTYSVTALDNHDCASEFTLPNVIASVNNSLTFDQGISIYPNPSAGSFTIEIATGKGWKDFILTDVTGKVLISEKIEGNKIVIDRQRVNLASAVYLCRFHSDNGSAVRKIIIE
jgi:PKD repeat protein